VSCGNANAARHWMRTPDPGLAPGFLSLAVRVHDTSLGERVPAFPETDVREGPLGVYFVEKLADSPALLT
jgi:hypothetical protein